MDWWGKPQIAKTPFTDMKVNGKSVAALKNVANVSFA